MKTELVETEPCKFSVHCEANFLEISDKRVEVEKAFQKAPVPGNRPGKASVQAIRSHYSKQIDESLKRALAESSYHEAIFEHKLRVHGAPKFNTLFLDGGKFTTDFEVYVKPDFELLDWKKLEIPKPHDNQDATEVSAKMMQELRERLGDTV